MSQGAIQKLRGVMVIADDHPRWKYDPVEIARAACAGGASSIQLRSKHATDRETLTWAREIRTVTREHDALFFVNDRFDLALLAEADGVHLGQHDLPPGRLPREAREQLLVGRSTHSQEQLERACDEPVDYLALGPIFETGSKASEYSARGCDALRAAVQRGAPWPLVAIGGITLERASEVAATGAAACAVISAVAGADDPESAARKLVQAFSGKKVD